jgi:hypothetical protein
MQAIANPWAQLAEQNPHRILACDQNQISQHNEAVTPDYRIIEQSIPEPYIGNPTTARVILLGLNPGHSDADAQDYARADFRAALFNNLRHTPQAYPFYPLNPAFANTGTGKWWTRRLRRLASDTGLEPAVMSERFMVIEWFPYHSRKFRRPRQPLLSQAYSFQLASQLMAQGRLVVLMRSQRLWSAADPEFDNLPALTNPQCAHVTPRNASTCYNAMVDRLAQPY